jgi:NAD(P)-dependent dehydrogenase (short-subunit alcohol dehydrogenase family)
MTRAWTAEFSPQGVRVNAVAPGPAFTGTPTPREFLEQLGASTALGRVAEPAEIAEAILLLTPPRLHHRRRSPGRRRPHRDLSPCLWRVSGSMRY